MTNVDMGIGCRARPIDDVSLYTKLAPAHSRYRGWELIDVAVTL